MKAGWLLGCALILCGCSRNAQVEPGTEGVVDWTSLLRSAHECTSGPYTQSRLFSSSSGSVVLTGYAPELYGDLDHGSFLRVEEVEGGLEAVLAEAHGAGVVNWIHSGNPAGELVLLVDGVEYVYPFQSFLAGRWLPVQYPFAGKTADGWNLHFPIIHKRHLKISVRAKNRAELGRLFYQVAWNQLPGHLELDSFAMEDVRSGKQILKTVAELWRKPADITPDRAERKHILPGETAEFIFEGGGIIRRVMLSAGAAEDLKGIELMLKYNGEPEAALKCPLYMLCGTTPEFREVHSLPVSVRGSNVWLRWPLSYQDGAVLVLKNTGSVPIELDLEFVVEQGEHREPVLRGNYFSAGDLMTSDSTVISLGEIQGAGAIVGVVMNVENKTADWWGEGDPLIWLDGYSVPAWRGTGTEDYFGAAWCSTAEFNHPLRGQSEWGAGGQTLYRYHLLDQPVFGRQARFGFEMRGLSPGLIHLETLLLWFEAL